MTTTLSEPGLDPITIANRTFNSRLCVGTGKYASMEGMRDALDASGAEAITVAVRRERLKTENIFQLRRGNQCGHHKNAKDHQLLRRYSLRWIAGIGHGWPFDCVCVIDANLRRYG